MIMMIALFALGYILTAVVSTAVRLAVISVLSKGRDSYKPTLPWTETGPASFGMLYVEDEKRVAPVKYGVLWPVTLPSLALGITLMLVALAVASPFVGMGWILKKAFRVQ